METTNDQKNPAMLMYQVFHSSFDDLFFVGWKNSIRIPIEGQKLNIKAT